MIDTVKATIAQRARELGLRFDENEIVTVPLGDSAIAVFLRSIKATRQAELEDGTLLYNEQGEPIIEEFNDPIIWMDIFTPQFSSSLQDGKLRITATTPKPKVTIKFPELVYKINL